MDGKEEYVLCPSCATSHVHYSASALVNRFYSYFVPLLNRPG